MTAAELPSSIGKEWDSLRTPTPGAGRKSHEKGRQAAESTGIEIPLLECREFYVGVKSPSGHGWARWAGACPPPRPGVCGGTWSPGVEKRPRPMGQRGGGVRLPHSPLEISFKETHYE